jgi:hypothetical protein
MCLYENYLMMMMMMMMISVSTPLNVQTLKNLIYYLYLNPNLTRGLKNKLYCIAI